MKVSKSIALLAALVTVVSVAPAQAELPAALKSASNAQVLSDQDAAEVRGESGSISVWGSFDFNHSTVQGALVQFQNKNVNVVAAGQSASVSYAGNVWDPTGIWARAKGPAFKSLSVTGGASGDIHVGKGAVKPYLRGAGTISFQETAGTFAQGTIGQFQFSGGSRTGLDIGIGPRKVNVHTFGGSFQNTTAIGAGTFRFPGSIR